MKEEAARYIGYKSFFRDGVLSQQLLEQLGRAEPQN
jgi:hypothetical protein